MLRRGDSPDVVCQTLARDRVLLYLRGMDLDPVLSLELALESLRRAQAAGNPPTPSQAMEALHALLREQSIVPLGRGDTSRLASAPPMNRRPMIAEEMDRYPLKTALKRCLRALVPGPMRRPRPDPCRIARGSD